MKIYCVVVTYYPDQERLTALCTTLTDSGAHVIVVDNTEAAFSGINLPELCTRITLTQNTGIAHAQNVGIAFGLENGADAIAFFDQDSEPDDTLLGKLIAALEPGKPGVAAPVCVEKTTRRELPAYRIGRLGMRRKVFCRGRMSPAFVDLIIASGSVATAATFSCAGDMDEDFFIDFVDFEWCMRCRSQQVPISVVPQATMRHSIGERTVDLGVLRGSVHSVSRSYYKIRNCFLLFRKPVVPFLFALSATVMGIVRYMLFLPFVQDRRSYLRVLSMAIRDGLNGVVGKNPALAKSGRGSN